VAEAARILKGTLLEHLEELKQLAPEERRRLRYDKFRAIGRFGEDRAKAPADQG
jgi:acetyl-CoA carboxylase carboxyl transferase subunit alpha